MVILFYNKNNDFIYNKNLEFYKIIKMINKMINNYYL